MEEYLQDLQNYNLAIELDSNDEWAISRRGETYRSSGIFSIDTCFR